MLEDLKQLETDALKAVDEVATTAELNKLSAQLLGKSAPLNSAKKQLGSLPPDKRKEAGRIVNETRMRLTSALDGRRALLLSSERDAQLQTEQLDLTEVPTTVSVGHPHIITQAWEALEDTFVGMGYRVAEGPEVETDWHNFDALNIPVGHPARDGFDSMYVDYGEPGSTLLRAHTSPVQIRTMLTQDPPIYIVAPGRVYRRDTADATHMPVFHQIEGLVIDRGISLADLAGTIDAFTKSYFGSEFKSRLRPNYFPFTEPSAEFDVQRPDGTWLELGGCGMVHPHTLRSGGVDPEEWTAFAFGFGIDRLALLKFGVDDLRELYRNDARFLNQF